MQHLSASERRFENRPALQRRLLTISKSAPSRRAGVSRRSASLSAKELKRPRFARLKTQTETVRLHRSAPALRAGVYLFAFEYRRFSAGPAYGFAMALYLDWLGRSPTRQTFPPTLRETHI